MIPTPPRVAFFTDCYHEVNGVARTSRQFVQFAKSRELPLLVFHAGESSRLWTDGSVTHLEFRRGFPSLPLDAGMAFDLAFYFRHLRPFEQAFRGFRPDIVHTTGPSDCGLLGMILAHRLRVPMVSSWHTNVHEYAGRRIPSWVPARPAVARRAESSSLSLVALYYRYARRTLAPNPELVDFLTSATGKPSALMERGIDTALFHPAKRLRECDSNFRIGYVGRLSREKNVRLLVDIQRELARLTSAPFHFAIVGQGDELDFLKRNLQPAFFRGVLHGEALSRAYAGLDAFVFPSETDTYGNVVLEAQASGVPPLVTNSGGPKFLVRHGETGFICDSPAAFAESLLALMQNAQLRADVRAAARRAALLRGWDAIFENVYETYSLALRPPAPAPASLSSCSA